jgi:hypothetical protein
MNNYEFLEILYNDFNDYFKWLGICIVFYTVIFRRVITSILDPLLISLIHSCLACAIPLFLFSQGYIKPEYLLQFLGTQIFYFIGFFIPSFVFPRKMSISPIGDGFFGSRFFKTDEDFINTTLLPFIILLVLQVGVYLQKGIPLFMVSRLEAYAGGTGFGVFARIIEVLQMFVSFFIFSNLLFGTKIVPYFASLVMAVVLVVFCIFSGSKGSFLALSGMIFAIVCAMAHGGDLLKLQKLKKGSLVILLSSAIVIVAILLLQASSETSTVPLPIAFGLRLISDGDIFWYSYPYETFKFLPGSSGFAALFADLLGFLRIVNWDRLPEALGVQLMSIHHPSDYTFGPNARHNIFGLVYFGEIKSLFFSFGLGLFLGIGRWMVTSVRYLSVYQFLFFYILYIKLCILETDPMLALTGINNCLFFFLPIYFLSLLSRTIFRW